MLARACIDRLVFELSVKEVFSNLLRRKTSARIVETDVKDDVSDCVWGVYDRDVVECFGCCKSQEADYSCIGF